MKDTFQLEIGPDGRIKTIYQEGIEEFAQELGAEVSNVCRLSNVEWEEVPEALNARFPSTKGWSVRSAKDQSVALRYQSSLNAGIGDRYVDTVVCNNNPHLALALFHTREEALTYEEKFLRELMYPTEERTEPT